MASNLELPAEHGVRIVAEGIRASVMDLQQRDRVVALKGDCSAEETARGIRSGRSMQEVTLCRRVRLCERCWRAPEAV